MKKYEIVENGKCRHTCGQLPLAKLYARRIVADWADSGFSLGAVKIMRDGKCIVARGESVAKIGSL